MYIITRLVVVAKIFQIEKNVGNFHIAHFSGMLNFLINNLSSILSSTTLCISHTKSCVKSKFLAKIWAHNLLSFICFFIHNRKEVVGRNRTAVTPISDIYYYYLRIKPMTHIQSYIYFSNSYSLNWWPFCKLNSIK